MRKGYEDDVRRVQALTDEELEAELAAAIHFDGGFDAAPGSLLDLLIAEQHKRSGL